MSPSPGDDPQPPDGRSTGGFASVLKGLAGSKLTKQAPSTLTPTSQSVSQPSVDAADAAAHHPGWSREQMELLERLKAGETIQERAAAADALRAAIADYPHPVLDVWEAAKDLIEPDNPDVAREAGWNLLAACVKHGVLSDLERNEYFQTLSAPANANDFRLQLSALEVLTHHGRGLSGFEYQVIPLLTKWLSDSFEAVRNARRHLAQATRTTSRVTSKGKTTASLEDKNFERLFAFILNVLKFNSKVADDTAVEGMIGTLQDICLRTSVPSDLSYCIGAINAIVTYSAIRSAKLEDCVLLLSSIFSLVPDLSKEAWHALANLFKSHHGSSAVRILLEVLRNAQPRKEKGGENHKDIKGALCVLQKLVAKTTEKGYPTVPLALLVDGLFNVTKLASSKVAVAILKLIACLFETSSDGLVNDLLVDEDWSVALDVAAACAQKITGLPATILDGSAKSPTSTSSSSDKQNEVISSQLLVLIHQLEILLRAQGTDFLHRQECITFLARVQHVLPESAATLVLEYYREYRCCCPSDIGWEENLRLVVASFFLNRRWSTAIRRRAMEIIIEVYDMLELLEDEVGPETLHSVIEQVLSGIPEENDTVILQEAVQFAVNVATSASRELFLTIMETLKQVLVNDRTRSPISLQRGSERPGSIANQSPSNVVTRGIVQLFIRAVEADAAKAAATYTALVHIARSTLSERDARLTAMKMLVRLRADWANRIFLINNTESEGLAAYLYRTEASLARKQADDAAHHHHRHSKAEQSQSSRSARGVSFTAGQSQERKVPSRTATGNSGRQTVKYQQLWVLPDPDALPESPSPRSSPILFSRAVDSVESKEGDDKRERGFLDLSAWLDAVLFLLTSGGDWEIYSFVLVHLPAQLSNHGIFRAAIPQIQDLRKLVCEMLRMGTFQEPPNASGPRRTDVSICLFNILTMILSYHNHFQKAEEDELVRTFMQGIADRTAKTCIHALSICCHELPLSVSKSLVTILHKMSQIITQPHVAMHILEFAACLSRLPHLYSNFHEEEYKIVFAICFTYLQSVRERRRAVRASHVSEGSVPSIALSNFQEPTASEDLPQYVYALAYHVITYWFLAVKLPDRPNHIGWIAKNLFADIDASAGEEQAQVTMDFLQRVTYADVSDSAEDPLFTEARFGKMAQKQWIIGNSIVTIKQAAESGWAEITKRQPSGTSAWTIHEALLPPQPHDRHAADDHNGRDGHATSSRNSVLPSHLLVQLLTTVPQAFEPGLRPLPLPDGEQASRGIRTFDRIPSVDGHKVGVIYIGEGQTKETEMLANVSGSRDYLRFLEGLGTLTKLKGATFNTQGLDREYDSDGPYTFCWRDRVTEMVFHVTTQMPTNRDHDPQCSLKKRHIGNDFVNIIWNDSGLPFDFNTFPSDFNYVNIVITPESRASFVASREKAARARRNGDKRADEDREEDGDFASPFHKVRVMSKPGFPEISPASDTKMVSLKALPGFVRLLALNASVFSLVWANREGGEHVSSWRGRLREINRLRERFRPKGNPSPTPPPVLTGGISSAAVNGGGSSSSGSTITQMSISGPTQQAQAQLLQIQREQQQQQQQQREQQGQQNDANSRPSSSVRDSFSSLRRASVVTFFTSTSEQTSHRSSMLSTGTTDTEISPGNGLDHLVESLDFSKWA